MSQRLDVRALRGGLIATIVLLMANVAAVVPATYGAGPTITATKTASYPNHGDGKAHPGDTITYTIHISDANADAHGVTLTDPLDPHTAFRPGSLKASPVALDDSYTATGNISISVPAPGVLANDYLGLNPTGTVTASDTSSSQCSGCNNVSVSGDGSFTYTPPANYTGPDSFHYTVSNSVGSSQGTVTITVSDRVVFVSASGSGSSCRPATPCTLATADGLSAVSSGKDLIYVESGTYSSAAITLNASQTIAGQAISIGTALSDAGITLAPNSQSLSYTASTAPVLNNSATIVTLGTNNLVEDLSVNPSGGSAILGTSITAGTDTVRDLTVTATSSANGVNLANNTGATFNFSNLAITAASGTGFSATGGGTITATQNNSTTMNTLATTTGTALNVQNTTIGASGLTFRSISANGAANGIVLNNTGSSGGLTVTGDGASDPTNTTRGNTTAKAGGGTITTGSGGIIQGTSGSGLVLTNTKSVTLTSMKILSPASGSQTVNNGNNGITATTVNGIALDNVYINGFVGNSGLRGSGVSNLSMQHTDIDGNGTTTGTETNDNWNVRLNDLSGNCGDTTNGCGWNNSLFFNSRENIVGIVQNPGSTANLRMTVTNSEFRDTTTFASPANDAFLIEGNGSAVTNITATGSTFKNVEVTGFQYVGNDSDSGTVKVQNSTFENTGTDINIAHGGGNTPGATALNFDISGNTERQQTGNPASTVAVNVFLAGKSPAGSSMVGTIKNNTIGNVNVSGSGSHVGDGIDINATGAGTITATVSGNTVHQIHQGDAFFAEANSGAAKINVSVHNNSFNVDQSSTGLAGGHFVGGADPSTDSSTLCLDMNGGNNTFHGDTTYAGVEMDALGNSNGIKLVGYSGTQDDSTQITNFINAQNPGLNAVTPSPIVVASNGAHITGVSAATGCGASFPAFALMRTVAQVTTRGSRTSATTSSVRRHSRAHTKQRPDKRQAVHKRDALLHPQITGVSNGTVEVDIPTLLPANKSVDITFQVTVNDPPNLDPASPQVSNQGRVSSPTGEFTDVLTDDPNVTGSANPTVVQVQRYTSATSVASSPNPSNANQQVTFTATVAAATGQTIPSGTVPTGNVQFYIDGTKAGGLIALTSDGNGHQAASYSTTTLTTGTHSVRVDYLSDGNFEASTGTLSPNQEVDAPPSITTQPSDQEVTAGTSVSFSAAASGYPTPTVQWQLSTDGGNTWNDITGATSTTYTFTTQSTDDGSQYRAVFTNTFGGSNHTATSNAATLTIDVGPSVTTNPSDQTVNAGSNASFSAAASGKPAPSVQWQVSTDGGSTWTNISGATSTTLSLTNVTASMDGNQYRAVFTNSVSTATSSAATLTVQYAPSVTSQPSNQTVNAGNNASFSAAASGKPAPSVQWQVSTDGGSTWTSISGATSTTLTLSSVTASMDGNQYRAVFTNSVSTATSSAATLTVQYAPSVTSQPSNQTVNAGGNASFSAAASGKPAPSVQWQVSTDGGSTWTNISGATSTTLTLTSVTASMDGNQYRAVFTNTLGTATSNAATLTIDVGPSVTTNPSDQTVNAGSNASFSAAASGKPAPSVQWQVSTDGGSTWANLTDGSGVSGSTTTTLTLSSVTASMDGNQYRAVFANTLGTATSSAASLTVQYAPSVTTNPTNQTVSAGGNASFSAAASGKPTPTVQWQVSIDGGSTWTNINGATSTTLSLTIVTASMDGNHYRAAFTNSLGTATTTAATLTVDVGPSVTTNPSDQTVNAGDNASFSAAASGKPTPTVQWQVSTDGGSTWTNVSGATSTTLTLTGVTASMDGNQYRAVFTNSVSSATSSAATLTVHYAPSVTSQPPNQTVSAGSNASFSAAASGKPAPSVQWQVSTDGGTTWTNMTDGSGVSGSTTTSLILTSVTASMDGNQYRAVFTNTLGTATTMAATLTVNYAPSVTGQPLNQTVNAGGNASFSAVASGKPAPSVQWQVSTDGGSTWANISGATSTTLSLTSVTASMDGNQYRAVFSNTFGGSDHTATSDVATLTVHFAPSVTTQPTNGTVTAGNPASFTAAASGDPTPTVQWQVSTDGGSTWTNISGATSATYTITSTTASQDGNQYRAVFTNTFGGTNHTATSNAATLTVHFAPSVTTQPTDQTVANGHSVSFTAAASGDPVPTVQWQSSIDGGISWNDVPGATSTTYTFVAVTLNNGYEYRAVFTNSIGTATTRAALLTVVTDTIPPTTTASASTSAGSYASGSWTNKTVTVVLSATDNPGGTGVKAITYSESGAQTARGTVSGSSTTLTISSEGVTTLSYFATDNAGNVEAAHTLVVKIDKTKPVVTYSGNAGTYFVDQTISIRCSATDALSGVASTTCKNISGPASSFGLGSHTFSASATDRAGNVGTGSTTFVVKDSVAGLCALTKQYFPTQPTIATSLCTLLNGGKYAGYIALVHAYSLSPYNLITPARAALLIKLAQALE